ncbi:unnamed protein product [Leptidea sinapis]|uniref:Uncharacterized protein n=1 Tax=Leptidea sinapis TaxID=189913 RepID=A0A5E4QXK5_9NEOP|nr:unnamed protein product [Leptidea sinapis]
MWSGEGEGAAEDCEERVIYVTYDNNEPYQMMDSLQMAPADSPLQVRMQDGSLLAITSLDGHSLQIVTQDGQTIPVEINSCESLAAQPSLC